MLSFKLVIETNYGHRICHWLSRRRRKARYLRPFGPSRENQPLERLEQYNDWLRWNVYFSLVYLNYSIILAINHLGPDAVKNNFKKPVFYAQCSRHYMCPTHPLAFITSVHTPLLIASIFISFLFLFFTSVVMYYPSRRLQVLGSYYCHGNWCVNTPAALPLCKNNSEMTLGWLLGLGSIGTGLPVIHGVSRLYISPFLGCLPFPVLLPHLDCFCPSLPK